MPIISEVNTFEKGLTLKDRATVLSYERHAQTAFKIAQTN